MLLCLAAACTEQDKNGAGNAPAATDTPVVSVATQKDTTVKDLSQMGFELYTSETIGKLKSGSTQEQVISKLGRPHKRSGIQLWEADGEYHQSWEYKGVELDMSSADSSRLTVNAILLTSPANLKTGRDIGIGSSSAEVEEAYGAYFNREESSDTVWVAGSIYGGLIFNLRNNKVSRIFLGAAAE